MICSVVVWHKVGTNQILKCRYRERKEENGQQGELLDVQHNEKRSSTYLANDDTELICKVFTV